jgi:hypothetical protein
MPIRWAYLKRVLAGAIFGLYIANLLYFLNPQIDITPGRLAMVTIVYGLICGLLAGTVLWLFRVLRVRLLGKPETDRDYRPHGFGFVVLAAFVATAIYWMHLEVFRIYLPFGAVRVLSKATNVITATSFALLLLWFAERNASRRTSRILFVSGVLLIAISSVFLYQRRDSYRTEAHSVVANVGTVAGQRPVIVVAIRNLPYDWILTMTGEGSLPFFEQARTHDYVTRLEPFPTMSPKSLWASVATGKLPFRHGVTGRLGYRTPLNRPGERFLIIPGGVGFKVWGLIPPVERVATPLPSGLSLPFWTVFERLGIRSAVIGWPWSEPSGASRLVTDRYFERMPRSRSETIPLDFAATVASFETVPADADTQRFNGTGNARQRIVDSLAADLTSVAILRNSAPGFALTVCTLGGLEQAQRAIHVFSNELPPRSTVKGLVLRSYAEQIDRILAALARDYPNHTLVVVSPSGPVAPELPATPYALLRDFVDPPDPSADDGFVLIRGPGIVRSDKPHSATAFDIVPTVLYIAGLPVARDMDGSILSDAFSEESLRTNPLSVVQTYEAQKLVVRRGEN